MNKLLTSYQNSLKIAYKYKNQEITYQELFAKASDVAKILQGSSSPILIYGHKNIEMMISIIACLLSKRAYIPIDRFFPQNRIEEIIQLSKATLCIKTEEIPFELSIKCSNLKDLKIEYENTPKEEIAYIMFTSGSTGMPKGVPISRENLKNFIQWISNLEPLHSYHNKVVLNQASFSFDLSVADIFYSLCNGHTLIGLDKKEQEEFEPMFQRIKKEKANILICTPTFMKYCLLNPEFHSKNYNSLECIYFCGEKLENSLVEKIWNRFPNLRIINAYGPTEATSAVCAIELHHNMLNSVIPVGVVASAATKIRTDHDEIVLSGKSVFHHYLGNSERITDYYTGDLGEIKEGLLYCYGRKDDQIKMNGYRIELGEIEERIKKIEGVEDACVIYKKSHSQRIKAFVVSSIDVEKIKEKLANYVPEYMIPKTITKIEKMPINEHGKIDRGALEKYD